MSTSTDLILNYLGERYRARTFVPLAIVLGIAGVVASGPPYRSLTLTLFAACLIAYCLVLGFRVWDDLEDRDRDGVEHPERVLVRASARAPFARLMAGAFGTGAVIVAAGAEPVRRLAVLAAGAFLLFAWYRLRRLAPGRRVVGAPVILVKYPLIAYVAAPPGAFETSVVLPLSVFAPIYVALLVHELIGDARTSRGLAK